MKSRRLLRHIVIDGPDIQSIEQKEERHDSPAVWERFQSAGIKHELNNRVSGNPQQCLDKMKAYEKVGLTRFILIFLDPEDAERFSEEVLPELRKS